MSFGGGVVVEAAAEMCWFLVILVVVSIGLSLTKLCDLWWMKSRRIRSMLSKQGVGGPRPSFLFGNVKDIQMIESTVIKHPSSESHQPISHSNWVHSTFPYLQRWTLDYGPIYMFSTGSLQHMYVSQPEIIKELKLHKSLDLGKPSYLIRVMEPMLGNGIIKANGHQWAIQRKLIAPEFFLHKVKGMIGVMEECTMAMIRTWESRLTENEGGIVELMVDQDLRSLSADIISRVCFGSSYSQGKNIFAKLGAMREAMSKRNLLFGLPNFKFLPTRSNRQIWKLKKEVEVSILKVIRDRQQQSQRGAGKDLLDMLLASAASDSEMQQDRHKMNRFMVDNCKNIYFAGHETTAVSASWTLMLLALYPEWQERVRAETIQVLDDLRHHTSPSIDMDTLRRLKTLTMVIQESLRLYSPSLVVAREAFADIKLGNFVVPKGVHIWSLVPTLHRDPENWGVDAHEFNPERFADGISEACKYPQAYVPFGLGPRLCVGQNFAMIELKIVLSLLLSAFSFGLSPNYRHSPIYKMLLMPKHGMRLVIKKL